MRYVRILAIAVLLLAGLQSVSTHSATADDVIPNDAVQVELIRTIDGDTIDVDFDLGPGEDRDRIRMIGIDTPETNYSYGNQPECYGEEASKKTDSLLVAASEIWVVTTAMFSDSCALGTAPGPRLPRLPNTTTHASTPCTNVSRPRHPRKARPGSYTATSACTTP